MLVLQEPERRKVDENISRRQCTIRYYVENVKVCQKSVCNIFGVTPRRIQYLVEKIKNGTELRDLRGRHENRPRKLQQTDKDIISDHISSFPLQENHYSRNDSSKKCLSPDLNLMKMHKLFLEKFPNSKVSLRTYTDVFKTKFNLRFGAPRTDTCAYCDKLFIKLCAAETETEKKSIAKESKIHHMRADAGYKTLKADTELAHNNPNLIVLCTDLQQVLYCPTLTHSSIFYQRQLATYNYAVHDTAKNNATMMLWHEALAHRGSTEVASALLFYIWQRFEPLKLGEERKLVVWSDRCVGQNNNWKMLTMFRFLILSKYFTQVDQKFLTTGHSFLPCDRDFSYIEKAKKTSVVYEPFQWTDVIAKSKIKNPFRVVWMHQSFFKDFTTLEKGLWKDPKCKITEGLWIQLCADTPTTLRIRKSHNILQPWNSFSLCNRKKAETMTVSQNILSYTDLQSIYKNPLPIKTEKLKNLQDMCDYIPLKYVEFYNNLTGN